MDYENWHLLTTPSVPHMCPHHPPLRAVTCIFGAVFVLCTCVTNPVTVRSIVWFTATAGLFFSNFWLSIDCLKLARLHGFSVLSELSLFLPGSLSCNLFAMASAVFPPCFPPISGNHRVVNSRLCQPWAWQRTCAKTQVFLYFSKIFYIHPVFICHFRKICLFSSVLGIYTCIYSYLYTGKCAEYICHTQILLFSLSNCIHFFVTLSTSIIFLSCYRLFQWQILDS